MRLREPLLLAVAVFRNNVRISKKRFSTMAVQIPLKSLQLPRTDSIAREIGIEEVRDIASKDSRLKLSGEILDITSRS